MTNTLISLQVIPQNQPTREATYALVDEAIRLIDASGYSYRVSALDTTIEGDLEGLLRLVADVQQRLIELGAPGILSQIKLLHVKDGIAMTDLTGKYDA